jgi:pimeloyl-ACP methyl ester carboxylesterase
MHPDPFDVPGCTHRPKELTDPISPTTTKGNDGMHRSPLNLRRNAARALAATCTLLLGGLALSSAAHADTPCPDGARCGSVTVPLDRVNPSAGTIDIAYELLPRTDTARPAAGTIVPNPGGPGQTTIANAGLYLQALAPLRRDRDLLLIDPRGTGQSGALSCPSLATHDPLSLDLGSIWTICGADLRAHVGLYGSAAVADDIDAVRAALGLDKLDLWGDSYGTFLMPVYAARHPERVRSIVLDGAFPIAFDRWGRDVLRSVRRVIGLVCRRTHRCSGPRVLTQIERLARRLRRHPVRFTAHTPVGPVRLTLGERELANATFGGGDPRVYGLLPAAVDAALDHDLAPLKRLVTVSRVNEVGILFADRRSAASARPPLSPVTTTRGPTTSRRRPRPGEPSTTARCRRLTRRSFAPSRLGPGSAPASTPDRSASTGRPIRPPARRCRDARSPTCPCSCNPAPWTPTPRSSRAAGPPPSSPTRSTPSSPTRGTPPTSSRAAWRWRSTSSST